MPRSADERGAGQLSTLFGVGVFFVLLVFAVQLVLNLYATSVVTAVAFDAARVAAGADVGSEDAREAAAIAHVDARLPGYAARGRLDLDLSLSGLDAGGRPELVEVTVVATHPSKVIADLPFPYQRVNRTMRVRLEEVR